MEIKQCLLTNNDCYKRNVRRKPTGIVVHSTGANNPRLSRYVQPDDGILGCNQYKNDWNRSGLSVCVNAFIGKDKNGAVRVYQTLPWDMRPWGCGSGSKGSYNDTHIQFEICEDGLTDQTYFSQVYNAAVELCVTLCKEYGIAVSNIVDHSEAHAHGYGTAHADITHWLKRFGKTMSMFRSDVQATLNSSIKEVFRIRKSWEDSASQIGAYSSLQNAKSAWKSGYFVYNSEGKVVYPEMKVEMKDLSFLRGHLIDVPLSMIEHIEYVAMSGKRGETVSAAARRVKWNGRSPTVLCNAELFNRSTFRPASSVVNNGAADLLMETYGFAFKDYTKPVFSYKNNVNAKDYIGAYPTLVMKGTQGFTKVPIGLGGNLARTFLALSDDSFALGYVPAGSGIDLFSLSKALIQQGYQYAINLDGGGSTAMCAPGFTYDQGRPVRGFVAIWVKGDATCLISKSNQPANAQQETASKLVRDESAKAGVKLYALCSTRLNIRKMPNTSSSVLTQLSRNGLMWWYGYQTADKKWYYVRCENGVSGYVSAQYTSRVKR